MKYLLLLSLLACATRYIPTNDPNTEVNRSEVDPIKAEVPEVVTPPAPIITITECRNCTEAEVEKYKKVLAKTRDVMHSQCFKDFILNRKMIQTSERTSQEVLSHVLTGNREITIELYYNRWVSTVGYTYPHVTNIWFNRKYHNSYGICESASNLSHEGACHKNGYSHDMNYSPSRDYSVCYSFNAAFNQCCKKE